LLKQKQNIMKAIVKGQFIKNMHGSRNEVTYVSEKRNLVKLADGSRYSINYALQINNK